MSVFTGNDPEGKKELRDRQGKKDIPQEHMPGTCQEPSDGQEEVVLFCWAGEP